MQNIDSKAHVKIPISICNRNNATNKKTAPEGNSRVTFHVTYCVVVKNVLEVCKPCKMYKIIIILYINGVLAVKLQARTDKIGKVSYEMYRVFQKSGTLVLFL